MNLALILFIANHVAGAWSFPPLSNNILSGELHIERLDVVSRYERGTSCTQLRVHKKNESGKPVVDRRQAIRSSVISTFGLAFAIPPYENQALASEEEPRVARTKPYAPMEALMPAIRVKRVVDKATEIARAAAKSNDEASLLKLQDILLRQQNFGAGVNAIPEQPAKQYLEAYTRNREQLGLLEKPGALLAQNGEIAAWKRLKRQESKMEQEDAVRAALNLYTTSLTFSASEYMLTVPKSVRSQMIREDRLPDVKQVIAADMGLRYLYRNEILTALEDARAELLFQLEQKERDVTDLVGLLQEAQSACDKWFALIDEQDVRDAMLAVESEERNQQTA